MLLRDDADFGIAYYLNPFTPLLVSGSWSYRDPLGTNMCSYLPGGPPYSGETCEVLDYDEVFIAVGPNTDETLDYSISVDAQAASAARNRLPWEFSLRPL